MLFDINEDTVTIVATDRYRLAVASIPVHSLDGPTRCAVVPAQFRDTLASLGEHQVRLAVDTQTITAHTGAVRNIEGELLGEAFPEYRQILPDLHAVSAFPITDQLRAALATPTHRTMRREADGADFEVAMLAMTQDGQLTVSSQDDGVGVNREFLLEAIDAGGADQLMLSLDGPVAPLVIRAPRSLSLLMPVRL